MPDTIICALISGGVTLVVSIGTWYISAKKDRIETQSTLRASITGVKEEIESVKDDISNVNATVQQQMAIQSLKIETLSERVEKHNNTI